MNTFVKAVLVICLFVIPIGAHAKQGSLPETVAPLLVGHPGKSGAYVLEKGEEALLARAWLADHSTKSIHIQYFIWSTDNIGILASEALLRAADRGVKVRVLVDDLLIDAPPETMLALALHPNIDIRIYNPKLTVGTSKLKRVGNVLTGFRTINQRMHDKTALFDGMVGITGGRNMADEYFDYDHRYNFRDRDILVLGPALAYGKELRPVLGKSAGGSGGKTVGQGTEKADARASRNNLCKHACLCRQS